MCLERGAGASPSAPTPHRPVRGRIPGRSASGAAVMSATATTRYPRGSDGVWMTLTTPWSPLPEPLGQNTASRCPHSPNGHSVGSTDRHAQRGEKHVATSFPPEIGVSPNLSGVGDWLPGRCLRSSGQGGTTGRRSGRTPRLPDEIPVTLQDRQPAAVTLAYSRPGPEPRCIIGASILATHPESAGHGEGGQHTSKGLPPATAQVTTHYPGALPG